MSTATATAEAGGWAADINRQVVSEGGGGGLAPAGLQHTRTTTHAHQQQLRCRLHSSPQVLHQAK